MKHPQEIPGKTRHRPAQEKKVISGKKTTQNDLKRERCKGKTEIGGGRRFDKGLELVGIEDGEKLGSFGQLGAKNERF